MSAICPRCGTSLPGGAQFCSSCGFALTEAREERRVVSVLFGDLTGFTEMSERLDPEEVKAIVDRAFEGLAELVTLYGGRVDKVLGDEIMAVFGAPQAHEDDPERAVRAGLEMQRQLARFSRDLERDRDVRLRMRIGINTGEVVAGVLGGGDAYTVLGDAVNIAKRIESAAEPGQTPVGEPTYVATAGCIEYRDRPPVVAKGKQEPLQVWEALAERVLPGTHEHRRTEAPLVGRDEELTVLDALARIVERDRRTLVVTIVGDAGMGKSRVAEEFARRLEPRGRVVAGQSLPYGMASPWFALEEIVRSALDVDPEASPEIARARVAERLAHLGLTGETQRLLRIARLAEPAPAGAVARSGGPAAGRGVRPGTEALDASLALLRALAGREDLLVLAFHEAHWAEDELLDFVATLSDRARDVPLMVLCLARTELLERRPAWAGRPGSLLLQLEPLPHDRAEELLDALPEAGAIHPALRERVLERAGGNPFYLEELVRLLVEQQAIGVRPTVLAVPGSVQGIVAARLDGLAPDARRLLQAASVAGDQFWPGALERLEPDLGGPEIGMLLEALSGKDLVERSEPSRIPGQAELRFRQTIVREVAYAGIPKQARARAHATVAGWLEDVTCACGREREFYDLVAHHYERATMLAREVGAEVEGAAAKAREYLERAGDEARRLDAATAASEFYERALALASGDADRLHLELHLAEALVGCWRPAEAEHHLSRALDDARRAEDLRLEGKALRLLGDLLRMKGEVDRARPHLERALEIAKEMGDAPEEVEGLRSHGLADLFQGRLSAAALWFRQSLARSRDIGDRRAEGWSLQNLAWANMELGRLDEAMVSADEAAAVFAGLGDIEGVGWSAGLRAWILVFQGKLSEANETEVRLEEALSAAGQVSAAGLAGFGIAIGRVLRSIIALSQARLGEAEALARSALAVFEDTLRPWGSAMGRYPLGMVAIMRRENAEARRILDEALQAGRQAGDPLVLALSEFAMGLALLEDGDVDGAERWRRQAWERTERAQVQWIRNAGLRWLEGRILWARGHPEEARAAFEEAALLRGHGFAMRAAVEADLALLLCEVGEPAAAVDAARRAVDTAGEDVLARAQGLRALGRSLAEAGKPADGEAALREELALLAASDWEQERVLALAQLARNLDVLHRRGEAGEARAAARAALGRLPAGASLGSLEDAIGPQAG
ncbi:MAG: AAA family ATPase [Acidobacteria bacterium]|nr:AAA family ATPase [Acidobacteriota bacterium]